MNLIIFTEFDRILSNSVNITRGGSSPRFSAVIPLFISAVCGLGSERHSLKKKDKILATSLGIAV